MKSTGLRAGRLASFGACPLGWSVVACTLSRCSSLAAVVLTLAACGTATIRQAHEISEAGKAYSGAMVALADVTIDRAIDESAAGLEKQRAVGWGVVSVDDQAGALERDRIIVARLVHDISIFKAHSARLGDYFDAVGKLAAEPANEGYATATKDLATSVGALGTALENTSIVKSVHVTSAQAAAIGTIGGAIGDWYEARAVRAVLDRDSTLIASQLVLQRKALQYFGDIVGSADALSAANFYRTKVRDPFVNGYPSKVGAHVDPPALPDEWKGNYATAAKANDVVAQIEDAKKASDKFAKAWDEFAHGTWTTADLVGDLTRVRDTLQAAQKAHENRHE